MTSPTIVLEEIDGAVRIATAPPAEQEHVIVAFLGDEPITVPKALPGNVAFVMLRMAYRRSSRTAGLAYLLEATLGAGQTARLSASGLTGDDLRDLTAKVRTLYGPRLAELGVTVSP